MALPQLPLDLKSTPTLDRADFFRGACNDLAMHWVEKWPAGWSPAPCLILHGPRGSGKSHLADVWRMTSGATAWTATDILATSTDHIVGVSRHLVIDRIDLLIGDNESEEKLFHLYNHFKQTGLYFLGLSRVSPELMQFTLKDLASRLRAAPQAAIFAPDDDVLLKVMARRFHDQGYVVSESALQFAVTRMERSWEALDHLVETTIRKATAEKKTVTIPLLRDILIIE